MKIAKILLVYATLLGLVEVAGQFYIRRLGAKNPAAGIEADNLLNHAEPLLGFGLKKNLNEKMGLWSVKTNRWGFRAEEDFPIEKPKDEYRIFVVGGSTVFGWGLENAESIPTHLQKQIDSAIQAEGKRIRVINAGVPWYASWHEASLVLFKLLAYQPDWIVILDGLNDVAAAMAPTWSPLHEGYFDIPTKIAAERRKEANFFAQAALDLLSLSPTFRYFRARAHHRIATTEGSPHPESWDQYLSLMDNVQRLTRSHGIRFSLFLQPIYVLDKPLEYYEIIHNGTAMANPTYAQKMRALYLEGEQKILASGLPARSLRSIFRDDKDYIYLDGLHYNQRGTPVLAKAILESGMKAELEKLSRHDGRVAKLPSFQ